MAETVGSDDESEFGSVTSSQKSFLKNCPFAGPESPPMKSSDDLDSTEILGDPISPAVTRTPILSLSTPMSLDSINDEDVFRTPPENASLSSAAESEVRVSEMKPREGGSKLKSPSTTPVSSSPSLPPENVRASETNRTSDSEKPVTEVMPLSSPPSIAAGDVRVPGKHLNLVSSSPSATEGIKITETDNPGDDDGIAIPFKDIIEALLRSSGENLYERDDKVRYVDILKLLGHKLP